MEQPRSRLATMKILPDNIRIYLINQQPLIFTSIKKGSLPEKISFYSVNILGVAVWIYLCKFLPFTFDLSFATN